MSTSVELDPKASSWRTLFLVGGVAGLAAGALFRRNIGAEVSLFTGVEAIPQSAAGWFALLESDPLIGLSFLAFFDLVDYALVGLVFLALCAALWPGHRTLAATALASGLVGIAVRFSANIALTMLSLSQQYAAATSEAQRAALLAAGQGVLGLNNPVAVYPTTGAFMSLLLIAVAGLLYSVAMLRGGPFGRATPVIGLAASACDLTCCLTIAFAPFSRTARRLRSRRACHACCREKPFARHFSGFLSPGTGSSSSRAGCSSWRWIVRALVIHDST